MSPHRRAGARFAAVRRRRAALLDEVRSHQIPLADTDAPQLVEVGNRAIARGQADLTATDTAITQDVRNTSPGGRSSTTPTPRAASPSTPSGLRRATTAPSLRTPTTTEARPRVEQAVWTRTRDSADLSGLICQHDAGSQYTFAAASTLGAGTKPR